MKDLLVKLVVSGFLLFNASHALAAMGAGVFVNLGTYFETWDHEEKYKDGTGDEDTDTNKTTINFSIGYSLGNGFILGAKYYNEVYNIDDKTAGGIANDSNSSTLGIMGGYTVDQFLFQFSYLALDPPKYENTVGNNTVTYEDGSGIILDFMYMVDIGSGLSVGPQLSYVQFDFDKRAIDGTEDTNFDSRSDSWFKPLFAVAAVF